MSGWGMVQESRRACMYVPRHGIAAPRAESRSFPSLPPPICKRFAIQQNDFSIARAQQRTPPPAGSTSFFRCVPMDALLGELVLPEEVLPEAPPIARSRYNPAYFRCPRSAKFKRTCKCGDAACGKGLCQHGLAKTVCKREQCILKAGGICKHPSKHLEVALPRMRVVEVPMQA